jgi:hypothetical protein
MLDDPLNDPLSRDALAAADDLNLSMLHLIPRAPVPRPHDDAYGAAPVHDDEDDDLQEDPMLALAQAHSRIRSALDHTGPSTLGLAPPPSGLGLAPPISGAQAVIGL